MHHSPRGRARLTGISLSMNGVATHGRLVSKTTSVSVWSQTSGSWLSVRAPWQPRRISSSNRYKDLPVTMLHPSVHVIALQQQEAETIKSISARVNSSTSNCTLLKTCPKLTQCLFIQLNEPIVKVDVETAFVPAFTMLPYNNFEEDIKIFSYQTESVCKRTI